MDRAFMVICLAAFVVPLAEALILALGEGWFHARFETAPGKFDRLIIQITTTGREETRVNQIIGEIKAFRLSMPHQIWVVNEPGANDTYPEADSVITVPEDFQSKAQYKARALEYSRKVRQWLGLNTASTKIIFVDDDTSPTRSYLETAFVADYDVCQGVTTPRIKYGALPVRHFLLSHMDDLRTLSCLVYCSFFQGVLRRPLYVHGEGLTITGEAEEIVTWDYPIFASEDLVFGQNAVHLGLRWGFFHEYIQLTSPWTWKSFLTQRRRWLWGNIHAILRRDVLPLGIAVMVGFKYVAGLLTFFGSLAGVGLVLSHRVAVPAGVATVFWIAFIAWFGAFALSGWVNSGGGQGDGMGRLFHRVSQTLAAMLLCPVTSVAAVAVLAIALFQGNPKKFEVIAKTAETAAAERAAA